MQGFTGLLKKSTSGICSGIFFILLNFSCLTFASEPTVSAQPSANQSEAVNETSTNLNASNTIPAPTTNPGVTTTTPTASAPAATKTNTTSQLASLIGGLALILVLIYGLSWFVKRFAHGGFMQSSGMKIISSLPLGTREKLVLVEVGGKQLLLGVTSSQINTIHVFDDPLIIAEKTQHPASDFSQKLMAILQKNNSPDSADKKV